MKWECKKEAACCELFAGYTLGTSPCPQLQNDKSCGCYSTRPRICRVSEIRINGLDMNEYLLARCALIHKLKEIKEEFGDTSSFRYIIDKIARSGIQ